MKQSFFSQQQRNLKEIDTLEPGTWINLVNPTQNESLKLPMPLTLTLPTSEHRSMRKKCLVLPLKMSIL